MPVLAFRKRVHTRLQIDQRARPGDSGDGRIRTAALTWGVVGCGFSLLMTVADSPCAMLIGGTTFREVGILSLSSGTRRRMPQFLLVFFGSVLLRLACCGKIKKPAGHRGSDTLFYASE
jgi:hypothetical protein